MEIKIANIINGDKMIISIIRTIILYIFIIFAVRLMGKRQISDLQPTELVITLVISDIAAIPMQNTSQPLLSGITPVLILVALEIMASVIMMKSGKFRKLICGNPIVIIEDGKLLQSQMKRLRLTIEDLTTQLRQQNIFSIEEIEYCIMETNGNLSILEKPQYKTPNAEDLNVEIKDNKIETVVISDGKILENSLSLCKKSKADIYKILDDEHTDIKQVFIMTLDALGCYNIIMREV